MTESLIPRLCFSKTRNSFPKEGWKKGNQNLPFFHSLPLPLAQDSLHLQNNMWYPETPHRNTLGIKWSFVFSVTRTSPPLSGLGCSADTTMANPWECPSRPGGLDLFLETLIAGLDPRPSDWWPFLTLVICWSPEHPVWPPSLVSLPHPSLSGIMVSLLI